MSEIMKYPYEPISVRVIEIKVLWRWKREPTELNKACNMRERALEKPKISEMSSIFKN